MFKLTFEIKLSYAAALVVAPAHALLDLVLPKLRKGLGLHFFGVLLWFLPNTSVNLDALAARPLPWSIG